MAWPAGPEALVAVQQQLGVSRPPPWQPAGNDVVGASYACFARGVRGPGTDGDPGWAGAAAKQPGRPAVVAVARGTAGATYEAGLLALREGPLRARAVRRLALAPAVILVDATGRDHPRRAGLAVHLGSVLDVPTVGLTQRPLLAAGAWPADRRGAASPLVLDDQVVGYWLRTRAGARPVAVHAAWRTDPDVAVEVALAATRRARTPQPLRAARRAARQARGQAGAVTGSGTSVRGSARPTR